MNEFFASVPLSVMPRAANIVTVPSTATLYEAARTLVEKNIQSAPVRDVNAADDAPWLEKYAGIVDLVGIVGGMLDCIDSQGHPTFLDIISHRKDFNTRKVTEAMGTWQAGPFLAVDEEQSTLLDVLLLLTKHNAHRVMVIRTGGDIVNVITQSAVLAYLNANKSKLTDIGSKQVKDTPLGEAREVYSVSIEARAVDAFQLLHDKKVHGVGVVSKTGTLIAAVSARDIHAMIAQPNLFQSLQQPLRVFFEALRLSQPDVRAPAIRCGPHDTLDSLVQRLTVSHIHRIFLTDQNGMCIRVISLGDILAEYVKDDPSRFGRYFLHKEPSDANL
eukprot:m.71857 g.71857  ORF g.71857 m.71857 type:complete len:331 (-) comp14383_c0_seq1:366-1358(-)